ncbi:quercetin dioxygenase-like cupin family protein [Luteibacter sp. 621]|uniref:hypothetical protein n=1 Tax=Luteibacter sp. 621 TaxID=3373916 RepID=UPI003D1B6AB4
MPSSSVRVSGRVWFVIALTLCGDVVSPCAAQTQDPGAVVTSVPCHFGDAPPEPGPACLLAHQDLGALPDSPVYWHIDQFATRAEAEAARQATGTVVTDFGKVWLFTIAGAGWHARGGTHIASIGPLPMLPATGYSAEYVHSFFMPGMSAPIHRHSGPEAFYAIEGDTCLEMPGGAQFGTGPGNQLIMPAHEPMLLMAVGKVPRRAFALILHDSTLPPTTRVDAWHPAGACQARAA